MSAMFVCRKVGSRVFKIYYYNLSIISLSLPLSLSHKLIAEWTKRRWDVTIDKYMLQDHWFWPHSLANKVLYGEFHCELMFAIFDQFETWSHCTVFSGFATGAAETGFLGGGVSSLLGRASSCLGASDSVLVSDTVFCGPLSSISFFKANQQSSHCNIVRFREHS